MEKKTDENGVRHTLVKTNGKAQVNWLFLPGGPGADAAYLKSLAKLLNMPGYYWLIDLPGNGTNPKPRNYDFNTWFTLLPKITAQYDNCVLVGHSFGGMLAMLTPELENLVQGLVILNSAPKISQEASSKVIHKYNIPERYEEQAFRENPCEKTYRSLFLSKLPDFFRKDKQSKGKQLLAKLPFPYKTTNIVYSILQKLPYEAKWAPQTVPTFLVGGERDFINPFYLFAEDERFNKPNITHVLLPNCGHWCWVEEPTLVEKTFASFWETIRTIL